jgi:hypothetical protein
MRSAAEDLEEAPRCETLRQRQPITHPGYYLQVFRPKPATRAHCPLSLVRMNKYTIACAYSFMVDELKCLHAPRRHGDLASVGKVPCIWLVPD